MAKCARCPGGPTALGIRPAITGLRSRAWASIGWAAAGGPAATACAAERNTQTGPRRRLRQARNTPSRAPGKILKFPAIHCPIASSAGQNNQAAGREFASSQGRANGQGAADAVGRGEANPSSGIEPGRPYSAREIRPGIANFERDAQGRGASAGSDGYLESRCRAGYSQWGGSATEASCGDPQSGAESREWPAACGKTVADKSRPRSRINRDRNRSTVRQTAATASQAAFARAENGRFFPACSNADQAAGCAAHRGQVGPGSPRFTPAFPSRRPSGPNSGDELGSGQAKGQSCPGEQCHPANT
jgi:hypothetical protein